MTKRTAREKWPRFFAAEFTKRFPRIPVKGEGRLNDPALRENFIERVFAMKLWREALQRRCAMGSLVAPGKQLKTADIYMPNEALLFKVLDLKGTVSKHTNVLTHILGPYRKQLSTDQKKKR
jgi:uncharacterized protein YbgA (DUF1722 family)